MFNKAILAGNITRDPELRYTGNGTPVCSFGLAVNLKYGEKEEVYFANIVAWKKLAELCAQYLAKGSQCLVEGRLTERQWEHEGKTMRKTEIVAENVRFLGGKKDSQQSQPQSDEYVEEPW